MTRHAVPRLLLAICLVPLGGMLMLTATQARDDVVIIEVMFKYCPEDVSPELVSEYTGARLLSFKHPIARFAVPKNQHEVYGLLFSTLPYTHVTDQSLQQHIQALRQDIDSQLGIFKGIDLNTLIVRFKKPNPKLLQEFATVFNVSIHQFIAPLELALVGVPHEQAPVYYTLLQQAPHVFAVDFNGNVQCC